MCSHLETFEPRLLLSGTTYVVDSVLDDVALLKRNFTAAAAPVGYVDALLEAADTTTPLRRRTRRVQRPRRREAVSLTPPDWAASALG
ncbi:MAG: LEPR-XLL domain-containing protein [Planctomycetes bacterium]|nr:LEPR-XLL domain-containing protein [Planctomycetota bacterium]